MQNAKTHNPRVPQCSAAPVLVKSPTISSGTQGTASYEPLNNKMLHSSIAQWHRVNILILWKMVTRKDWSKDIPKTSKANIKHCSYSPEFRAYNCIIGSTRVLMGLVILTPPTPCHLQHAWPLLYQAPVGAGSLPWHTCNAPGITTTILRCPLQLRV